MNSSTRTTSPSDFVIVKSYVLNNKTITGEFPVYITTASQCCADEFNNQTITPVTLPTNISND